MPSAREKQLKSGRILFVDYSAPKIHFISNADRRRWGQEADGEVIEAKATPRAVRAVLQDIVNLTYPQGIPAREGKMWAAWQETFDDDAEDQSFEVTYGQVKWLYDLATKEDARGNAAFALWREAVVDYLKDLLDESDKADVDNVGNKAETVG